MSQSGCGSGSGGHGKGQGPGHGIGMWRGRVPHQSSTARATSFDALPPAASAPTAAEAMSWATAAEATSSCSFGGSGWGLRSAARRDRKGPWGKIASSACGWSLPR
jgi:hypothetical protein